MDEELFFTQLALETADAAGDGDGDGEIVAPARFRARLYSALVSEQAASGPLESLAVTRQTGGALCVFEEIVAVAPVSDMLKSKTPCRVCHARVPGEQMDRAPIYWPHCPYAEFYSK